MLPILASTTEFSSLGGQEGRTVVGDKLKVHYSAPEKSFQELRLATPARSTKLLTKSKA